MGDNMKLIFLGPPGVGKGTYSKEVVKELNLEHISTGDLLRNEIRQQTGTGLKAKSYMDAGELVPDSVVIEILSKQLEKTADFILDGFPRNIEQAKQLHEITDIDYVVYFRANEKTILDRITGRRVCGNCGATYHITNLPPSKEGVCDKCGGELIQRSDEKPEVVKERLRVYNEQTMPLIDYYRNEGKLVEVEAEGTPEDIVKRTISRIVD